MYCFRFLVLIFFPILGYSFSFQFNNTEEGKNYRIFSASLQKIEQNSSDLQHVTFEQGYEAFLRSSEYNKEENSEFLKGEYHYSQRPFGSKQAFNAVAQDKIYKSYFSRLSNGKIQPLSKQDIYPIVRSVPVFPKKDLNIGDSWNDTGEEAQDFSALNFKDPFLAPFIAQYNYIGDVSLTQQDIKILMDKYKTYDFETTTEAQNILGIKTTIEIPKTNFAIIHIHYIINYKEQDNPQQTIAMEQQNGDPVISAKGYYDGIIFWNKDDQEEILDIGYYDFTYNWKNGDRRRWSGKEYGFITVLRKDQKIIEKLAEQAQSIDKTLEVEKQKEGIKVILGDLLFNFNKTTLRPEVIKTLDGIKELLEKNSSFAIHITGHSDDIGSMKAKEKIADGRAASVANFFVKQGIDASRITFSGVSDSQPRVPNNSSANRQKNRRVEIDIITQ